MPAHHARNSETELSKENVIGPVTVTATGAVGTPVSGFSEATTLKPELVVSSVTGTTPSYTVKLQGSQDGGVTWNDIASGGFTAATTTANQELSLTGPFDDQIRAFATVSGTTPSATVQVNLASYITDYNT